MAFGCSAYTCWEGNSLGHVRVVLRASISSDPYIVYRVQLFQ